MTTIRSLIHGIVISISSRNLYDMLEAFIDDDDDALQSLNSSNTDDIGDFGDLCQ